MRPAPNKEAIVPRKYRCTEQESYCSTQATWAVLFHARCRKNEVHVSTLHQTYHEKVPHVKSTRCHSSATHKQGPRRHTDPTRESRTTTQTRCTGTERHGPTQVRCTDQRGTEQGVACPLQGTKPTVQVFLCFTPACWAEQRGV